MYPSGERKAESCALFRNAARLESENNAPAARLRGIPTVVILGISTAPETSSTRRLTVRHPDAGERGEARGKSRWWPALPYTCVYAISCRWERKCSFLRLLTAAYGGRGKGSRLESIGILAPLALPLPSQQLLYISQWPRPTGRGEVERRLALGNGFRLTEVSHNLSARAAGLRRYPPSTRREVQCSALQC